MLRSWAEGYTRRSVVRVGWTVAALLAFSGAPSFGAPQDPSATKVTQTAGVDNTSMGAYRALAQLSFQAAKKGDNATAATLARILERTWDRGEWKNSSAGSFCTVNRPVCQPVDQALDAFIGPIMGYQDKAPDLAAVEAAYNDFLSKLKQADR